MFGILNTVLLACETEAVGCDTMAAYSTSVVVADYDGNAVPGVAVTYVVDGEDQGPCDAVDATTFACGVERKGHFVISAVAGDFIDTVVEVDVAMGECHVVAEHVTITMDEVVCTAEYTPAILVALAGSSGETLDQPMVEYRSADVDDAPWEVCEGEGANWQCAFELSGTFDIKGSAAGHAPAFELVTVVMDETGCHPVTQSVALLVDWLPD